MLLELQSAEPHAVNWTLRRLLREVRGRCLAMLHQLLVGAGRQGEAEDLLAEFLARLPRDVASLRADRPGFGWRWIQVVLLNRARDHLRRRHREILVDDMSEPLGGAIDVEAAIVQPVEDDTPERCASACRVVREALRSTRRAFRAELDRNLRLLRDHDVHEIPIEVLAERYFGANTAETRNKVSQYKGRALKKLQQTREQLDRLLQAQPQAGAER